ncbi:S-adenosyl-L-methionine dependent methyltransferase [Cristinia sonorae]|uniref:S-adenosyl-L-methionine dependent methyltransferase n=1 Tax=Cristinia sonorae TaxID=1940300 RepID=A0A8K0V0R6_9AGAR|nr:S-adenosyl-L-methionine dependent methyltransferase [Cristinia sonorae]
MLLKESDRRRKLTEAILFRDFQVTVQLPENRLCPPVPNRLNYILWLEDILEATAIAVGTQRFITGIDIGTGASAIYPLLGCRSNENWRFVATELDAISFKYAESNIKTNALQDRISILKAEPSGPLLLPLSYSDMSPGGYDFTMCNPPFYESRDEILRSAEGKEVGPNAVCTGADVEMITDGGEAAFVSRMVLESIQSGTRCKWYTSMLGKRSSLTQIVKSLNEHNIDNYAITEFIQGQTRRWAIAWSFTNIRLPEAISRISNPSLQNILPTRNTLQRSFNFSGPPPMLGDVLHRMFNAVEGVSSQFITPPARDESTIIDSIVFAQGNTWSRAARRKKRTQNENVDTDMLVESEQPKLICRLRWRHEPGVERKTVRQVALLVVDWVRGDDRGLFESFTNHIWRKVEVDLAP